MKILVAPLNWGLGHASRCIPVVARFLCEGNEVVIAGDGDSLILLKQHFPQLRTIELPELHLRYSAGTSQTGAILKQMPRLLHWAIRDHLALRRLLSLESFDRVISDNRFGFYSPHAHCIYLTHQLHICLPSPWKWMEPVLEIGHRHLMKKYSEVWIPDNEGTPNFAGLLSHPKTLPANAHYIGPLSRFSTLQAPVVPDSTYNTVLLLSGLEPQRSILEQNIINRYQNREETLLVVQGKVNAPFCKFTKRNITIVPYLNDAQLLPCLMGTQKIIARSGYSSIMDFAALGILPKCELIPTQGQPEQEYLATYNNTL